ncbi:unnamed protein product (macronuclear) [Paramecium tetraurelia]|uniref:Uncharacterized protein n=1 Tax=Paramecium tetraurelia TaxID=5888 RepID=A0CGQ4_PARTE|nr:uncharacterized protein GSPATT00007411001 [Paramecium tetraurelia]CAK69971.1 unnamed protein product [Paramecium tetraurelia]|eukprot:XP_001437368.1 hypothetical protein (macronuclear) [Paramecium tetraurelia strain d4-2]
MGSDFTIKKGSLLNFRISILSGNLPTNGMTDQGNNSFLANNWGLQQQQKE